MRSRRAHWRRKLTTNRIVDTWARSSPGRMATWIFACREHSVGTNSSSGSMPPSSKWRRRGMKQLQSSATVLPSVAGRGGGQRTSTPCSQKRMHSPIQALLRWKGTPSPVGGFCIGIKSRVGAWRWTTKQRKTPRASPFRPSHRQFRPLICLRVWRTTCPRVQEALQGPLCAPNPPTTTQSRPHNVEKPCNSPDAYAQETPR